jgi:hypothetical protein
MTYSSTVYAKTVKVLYAEPCNSFCHSECSKHANTCIHMHFLRRRIGTKAFEEIYMELNRDAEIRNVISRT